MDLNVLVGGEAGQGVQSAGGLLTRAFARAGYYVFADQDYESRVRGGHNFYRIRASRKPVGAIREGIDILIAMNQESVDRHRGEVITDGIIIFDSEKVKINGRINALGVPLEEIALESAGDKLMANTVALGAVLGLLRYDSETIRLLLEDQFKKDDIAQANIRAAGVGYAFAINNFKGNFSKKLVMRLGKERLLINGNEAIALGAIAAGCNFMSAYPMTPASSIMEYFAKKADSMGLAMIQAEDEISAVNMAIGASFAGSRAMTATSGSGFCLMIEGLTLAGITETPLVVIDAQRPGPACGLPTRNEQGDLQFAIHAGHGDFPRAVLAPADAEECFWMTVQAFNLADRFQTPVILLTDQHMASSYVDVEKFDLAKVKIDRGQLLDDGDIEKPGDYRRYEVTESGISPRAIPGGKALVVADADEHNAEGHLIEDAETRIEQMEKRMRKLEGLSVEVAPLRLYPRKGAKTILIGWGSTYAAIREAVGTLRDEREDVAHLHLSQLWPFPANDVSRMLQKSDRTIVVESNTSGQMVELLRSQTGIKPTGTILKFDGRPFTSIIIADRFRKEFA